MVKKILLNLIRKNMAGLSPRKIVIIIIGTAISSFGVYNIHQLGVITEGGVLGMILLANHWLGLSPAIATPALDIACYALAFRYLGGAFIRLSAAATLSLAGFFRLWEQFPRLLPDMSGNPLLAALCGGVFVGLGVGLIVRQGGSGGGDDALALTISRLTKWKIARAYLVTDITVLALSLSYIPFSRIAFSLVTVTVSSLLIGFIQEAKFFPLREEDREAAAHSAAMTTKKE
ncbi:MAG: YitT family protein [bacterium]|nr:YitT family protein [bacterium]